MGPYIPPSLMGVYVKFQKHRPVYKLHNSTIVTISNTYDKWNILQVDTQMGLHQCHSK